MLGKPMKIISGAMVLMLLVTALAACNPASQTATQPTETENIAPTESVQNASEPAETLPPVTAPEDEKYTEPPTQPPVAVEMPEYTLTYSGEMSEIISYEEQPENTGLKFFVTLSTGKTPLFTLYLNRIEGELVVMKKNTAGEEIPVTFLMEEVPENLSQEEETAFCLAQETVNDIIASLVLK